MGITIVQKSDLKTRKRDPKVALVLAGGAITGGAFKLGGLKALDDFLVNRKTTEFDTYVGLNTREGGGPSRSRLTSAGAPSGSAWSSTAPMASTVKAMLMVAYLRQGGVRHRRLDPGEKDLLGRMIRYSDNGAATTV